MFPQQPAPIWQSSFDPGFVANLQGSNVSAGVLGGWSAIGTSSSNWWDGVNGDRTSGPSPTRPVWFPGWVGPRPIGWMYTTGGQVPQT